MDILLQEEPQDHPVSIDLNATSSVPWFLQRLCCCDGLGHAPLQSTPPEGLKAIDGAVWKRFWGHCLAARYKNLFWLDAGISRWYVFFG